MKLNRHFSLVFTLASQRPLKDIQRKKPRWNCLCIRHFFGALILIFLAGRHPLSSLFGFAFNSGGATLAQPRISRRRPMRGAAAVDDPLPRPRSLINTLHLLSGGQSRLIHFRDAVVFTRLKDEASGGCSNRVLSIAPVSPLSTQNTTNVSSVVFWYIINVLCGLLPPPPPQTCSLAT